MPRKAAIALVTIVLLSVCYQSLLNSSTLSVHAAEPTKLKIYVAPPSVLADKGDYEIILIQLQDSRNVPARAFEDTSISLSSSQTNIGTVDSSIIIPKGSTQATAKFHTTYTPGTTKITAAATGYLTVEASITTVGPIPSTLAVYGFPPVLPADGGAYEALVVQLQDASGSPAKAPLESVQVYLSSSNNTVAAVIPSVTIEAGSTFAIAAINTTQDVTGSAVVTAMASGYSSKQTTITTRITATQASTLKIYIGPPKVLAEGKTYNQILVQLHNASGHIAQITRNIIVTLSSFKTDVGTVEPTITIPALKTYATANFTSTFRSGTTTITAAATDYTSAQETVTTVGPIPTKLAIYCMPSLLPADNQHYKAIQVQLQDAQGKPAKDPEGNITVSLFSSEPECGTVETTLSIPFGETYATGIFTSTAAANKTTTITAQTSGYESGQAVMTTSSIDEFILSVTVTANPETIRSGQQITLRARVTHNITVGILKAKVAFTASISGILFSNVTEEGNGYYVTSFTAPNSKNNTICTITANASKTGYISGITQLRLTLNPGDVTTSTVRAQIMEENGKPIGNASVTMLSESTQEQRSDTTDETGYVIFENILEGNYIIQVTKDGYDGKNETITCSAGGSFVATVTLIPTPFLSLTFIIIIIVIVTVVVSVVVVIWYLRRRGSNEDSSEESTEENSEESTEEN